MLDRRGFVGAALAAGVAARAGAVGLPGPSQALAELEQTLGGRLGVAVIGAGRHPFGWREHQRFAFCSSFKLSLAAVVLQGAERGEWRLDEALPFGREHVLPNSPALQARLAQCTITIGDAAEAAQKLSDNGASNLLLRRMGGLERINRFWRGLGDKVSRLDDYETALNRVPLGAVRNTTTPMAMARNLVRLMGQGRSVATLKTWMHDTTTGKNRLRAGLPIDWWAGDKTGTGLPADIPGTYVDLAWVEPVGLPPVAIAAFYQPPKPTPDGDPQGENALAQVGRIAAQAILAQKRG